MGLKEWRERVVDENCCKVLDVAASQKIPIHYERKDLERDFQSAFGETV